MLVCREPRHWTEDMRDRVTVLSEENDALRSQLATLTAERERMVEEMKTVLENAIQQQRTQGFIALKPLRAALQAISDELDDVPNGRAQRAQQLADEALSTLDTLGKGKEE